MRELAGKELDQVAGGYDPFALQSVNVNLNVDVNRLGATLIGGFGPAYRDLTSDALVRDPTHPDSPFNVGGPAVFTILTNSGFGTLIGYADTRFPGVYWADSNGNGRPDFRFRDDGNGNIVATGDVRDDPNGHFNIILGINYGSIVY